VLRGSGNSEKKFSTGDGFRTRAGKREILLGTVYQERRMSEESNLKLGEFQYQQFWSCFYKCWMFQWEYLDLNGMLHSGVARSVEAAKKQAARHGYREAA
jgi:hypothetical protein